MYKVLNSSECRDEVKIIAKARRDAWKSKILPLVSCFIGHKYLILFICLD